MLADHIKFLKTVIEGTITDRNGTGRPLAGRFLEIYPEPSTIEKKVPCAVLAYRPGRNKKTGTWDSSTVTDTTVVNTKQLYVSEQHYQVDFYSADIYDFIEADSTYEGHLKQFVLIIANNPYFTGEDGRTIEVTAGAFGVIDDPALVREGPYKAFCQVVFKDGVYRDVTVPRITGVQFNEGGILNG